MTITGDEYDTFVDGVSLRSFAWNVRTFGGLMGVPAKRSTDRELPGLHGVLHVGGEVYEPGVLMMDMWVVGSTVTGGVPSVTRRAQMQRNARDLMRLFSKPGLRKVEQESELGVVFCMGKCVNAVDFTTMAGATRAEFKVELAVPEPFWKAAAVESQTIPVSAAGEVTATAWVGAFGPQTGLVFELTGPWANPRIEDPSTGQWVEYVGSLSGGETLVLSGYESMVGSTNVLADVRRGGVGTSWLDLSADDAAGPKVLAGGSPASGATLKITGRKQYLIP